MHSLYTLYTPVQMVLASCAVLETKQTQNARIRDSNFVESRVWKLGVNFPLHADLFNPLWVDMRTNTLHSRLMYILCSQWGNEIDKQRIPIPLV